MKKVCLAALPLAALFLAGTVYDIDGGEKGKKKAVVKCPVKGKKINPGISVEHNGGKVNFC